MAGPGGVEEGRVSVRVVPDTSKFADDLRADLARLSATLRLSIPVSLDTSGIAEHARLASAEAQAAAGRINIKTNIDSSQLAPLEKGLTSAATSGEGLSSSLAGMPALIGAAVLAAAALAPALAVAIPFAVGIAGAVGAIALSLKGLKTVFKPLADGFKTLQAPITAIVTQGLEPLVKSFTSGLLPVLTTGLGAAAGVVNQVLKAFLSLGQDTKFLGDLGTLMQGAATAFLPLASTIPKVAEAFTQIGVAALPALQALTAGFAGVLNQFATAITNLTASGRLTAIITSATTALQSLGSLGGAALSTLLQLGAALAPALTALGNALTVTLQSATPQLVQLATVIGVSLTAAITKLTPFIPQIVSGLTQMSITLVKTAPQFARLFQALEPLLAPLARLALVLLPAVAFALNGPILALARLSGALATAINGVSRFAGLLAGAVGAAIAGAKGRLDDLVTVFHGLPGRIVSAVGNLSSVLVNAGRDIISGLINGITSQLGHLGSVLGGVGSFIKDHKGPPAVDRVMLVPAGQMIMDGLTHGFESRLPNVKSSLGAITAALPGAVTPGGSGGGAGVQIENFYATDMDEAVRKLTAQQRDAAIVENVRLALVG
jgi:hypothetical protein